MLLSSVYTREKMKLSTIVKIIVATGTIFTAADSIAASTDPSGKVAGSTITIKNGFTDDVGKAVTDASSKIKKENLVLALEDISDEDLAKIIKAYPDMKEVKISSKKLTKIDPLKDASVIKSINIKADNVTDFSALAKFKNIEQIHIDSDGLNSVKWMSDMTNINYGTIHASNNLKSLEGIPVAPKVKNFSAEAMDADLTPLSALSNVESLRLTGAKISDLKQISSLKNIQDLSLYGASVGDFTPLSELPKLSKLTVYATKGGDYSSLGNLSQVNRIETGMTAMTDLEWVKKASSLKELRVFSEKVNDYSPVNGSSIEDLNIWNMAAPVDLSQLKDATNLTKLTLNSCTKTAGITHTEIIGTMTNLKELDIKFFDRCNSQVDASFGKTLGKLEVLNLDKLPDVVNLDALSGLASLKKLKIARVNQGKTLDLNFLAGTKSLESVELVEVDVSNFDAVAACTGLHYVDIAKASGITSLKALKALPELKTVIVKKGSLPAEELTGFANPKIKVVER